MRCSFTPSPGTLYWLGPKKKKVSEFPPTLYQVNFPGKQCWLYRVNKTLYPKQGAFNSSRGKAKAVFIIEVAKNWLTGHLQWLLPFRLHGFSPAQILIDSHSGLGLTLNVAWKFLKVHAKKMILHSIYFVTFKIQNTEFLRMRSSCVSMLVHSLMG